MKTEAERTPKEKIKTRTGGVLIITLPGQGALGADGECGRFYFDRNHSRGRVRDALSHWFLLWGYPLQTGTRPTGPIETGAHEVLWCDAVPERLHGPQTIAYFASNAQNVLRALDEYEPSVIILLSAYLYEALGTAPLNELATERIGRALGPAKRITQERLRAYSQRFERCALLVLPTPSKNTTDSYVRSLTSGVREAFENAGLPFGDNPSALREKALSLLVLDKEETIRQFSQKLNLKDKEALALLDSLIPEHLVQPSPVGGKIFLKPSAK